MISVIIPYYNPDGRADTEQLLYRAVQSVVDSLNGSCQYQVIVVDDGSFRIATGLPAHFSGKPIHLECARHGCLGAARNRGLELAQGDLVSFLDADDVYLPASFRQCVQQMEQSDSQALSFRMIESFSPAMPSDSGKADAFAAEVMTGDKFMRTGNLFASSCLYIFRKQFLKDNRLCFVEGKTAEDEEFTPRMLTLCQKLTVSEITAYVYCHRTGSITDTETPERLKARIANARFALGSLKGFRRQHQHIPHKGLDRKIATLQLDIQRLRFRIFRSYFRRK